MRKDPKIEERERKSRRDKEERESGSGSTEINLEGFRLRSWQGKERRKRHERKKRRGSAKGWRVALKNLKTQGEGAWSKSHQNLFGGG